MLTITINSEGKIEIQRGESKKKQKRAEKGNSLLIATKDFVALDIETTGLSPEYDEIIEIGAIRVRDGIVTDKYEQLIKPNYPIDSFITALTGITNDMLKDAPKIDTAMPDFLKFVGNDIVVGHNVNFDVNFIYDDCIGLGLPAFTNDFIDTMRLARRMYKDFQNHKLDTLISEFKIETRTEHRALNDSIITAQCYLHMIKDTDRFAETVIVDTGHHKSFKNQLKELQPNEELNNPDSPIYGKVCVFTGTLEHFSRKAAAQLVIDIGGICEDSVTKRTNILVLGNNDYCSSIKGGKSNKQKKAEQLIAKGADLIIVSETVFLDMIGVV